MPRIARRKPSRVVLSHSTTSIGKAMSVSGRSVYQWCHDGLMKASVIPGQRRLRIRAQDAKLFARRYGLRFDESKL